MRLSDPKRSFVQVLLGPRQTGKSTLIRQVADSWTGAKEIASADGLTVPGSEWIEFLWQKATEQSGRSLLAIDEIQKVRGWSEVVKILFDKVWGLSCSR